MSFIYFLRVGNDGPVKIGVTRSPSSRLSTIGGCNANDLTLLRLEEGDRENEKWLHEIFAHRNIRGEWFSYDPDMLSIKFSKIKKQEKENIEQEPIKNEAQEIVIAAAASCPPGSGVMQKISFAAKKIRTFKRKSKKTLV